MKFPGFHLVAAGIEGLKALIDAGHGGQGNGIITERAAHDFTSIHGMMQFYYNAEFAHFQAKFAQKNAYRACYNKKRAKLNV